MCTVFSAFHFTITCTGMAWVGLNIYFDREMVFTKYGHQGDDWTKIEAQLNGTDSEVRKKLFTINLLVSKSDDVGQRPTKIQSTEIDRVKRTTS